MMTHDQAQTVAAVMSTIRRDWLAGSIVSILASIRDRPFEQVMHAGVAIALDPATQTPKRILQPGPWWLVLPGATPPPDTRARCAVRGHELHPATTCRLCRSQLRAGHALDPESRIDGIPADWPRAAYPTPIDTEGDPTP